MPVLTILDYVLKLIEIIFNSAGSIEKALSSWNEESKIVQKMKDEGRGPTSAEWEALIAKSQANTDELNSDI
jgi:hypothetical protein